VFPENSIFRIDHFLGKEAIMNILYFRFANSFLEPGFARLCWATTNTMPFRVTRLSCASSNVAFAGCGGAF
jgi:hypothetical protein